MFRLRFFVLALFFELGWTITEKEIASLPPIYHIDDYDNCMLHSDKALFCKIDLELFPTNKENVSEVWNLITEKLKIERYFHRHAICLTKRCPQLSKSEILKNSSAFLEEVSDCYGGTYEHLGLRGKVVTIICRNKSPVDGYDLIFGMFIITIIGLVLFAWFYDISYNPKIKTTFDKYISSFSLTRNWKRLTTVDLTDPDTKAFSCLQGVRVLNCSHIIFFHASFLISRTPNLNPWFIEEVIKDGYNPIRQSGFIYNQMQPFFFLSAWLLTHNCLKEIERKHGMSLGYILHRIVTRYLRLTPLMIISVFLIATLVPHMSDGPFWEETVQSQRDICRKEWWRKILYLRDASTEPHEMCLKHLWSLSVDFYFYIAIMVILWVGYKYPKKILWVCGVIWVLHVFCTYFELLKIHSNRHQAPTLNFGKRMAVYSLTMTNVPAALSGAVSCYIYYMYKETLFVTKKSVWTAWILILTAAYLGLLTPELILTQFKSKAVELFMIYVCLTRTFVNIALGLFILVLTKGSGGIIRKVLASKTMYILGRLTYAAYIIHPFILFFKIGLLRAPLLLSNSMILYDCLMDIIGSFCLAVPVTLFFEMPFNEAKSYVIKGMRKREPEAKKID